MEFVKALPPRKKRVPTGIARQALKLQERPGEWAIIRRYSKSRAGAAYTYVNHHKNGRIATFHPDKGFTLRAQVDNEKPVVNVWAMWESPSGGA